MFSQKVNKIEDWIFKYQYLFFCVYKKLCVIEVGAHQGEVSRYLKAHNTQCKSYEANPGNYTKYNLEELGVINAAVVAEPCDTINLNIPRREWQVGSADQSSGKGSILQRERSDFAEFDKVEVKAISINEIFDSIEAMSGLWLDCEGLALQLIKSISEENSLKCGVIYAEFETEDVFSGGNTMSNLTTYLEGSSYKIFGKARTSHNQYNVILVKDVFLKNPLQSIFIKSYLFCSHTIFSLLHPIGWFCERILSRLGKLKRSK